MVCVLLFPSIIFIRVILHRFSTSEGRTANGPEWGSNAGPLDSDQATPVLKRRVINSSFNRIRGQDKDCPPWESNSAPPEFDFEADFRYPLCNGDI
ncbi:unnamed protein product [Soboliphyme baturini]|uniref:AGC-kinase C-terminal domain-containing protein n=1 Tax=Soboliphyme baturini TaxID=241478 RepID=A0A183JAK0_9BILA|nr:unnamed protein product [Soboliphyme baturini]